MANRCSTAGYVVLRTASTLGCITSYVFSQVAVITASNKALSDHGVYVVFNRQRA
jgi:hypothetical protein